MYLPTASINNVRRTFKSRACLIWDEIRELNLAGIEFGSHTINHPRLVQLMWPAIETELRDSRTTIEQALGAPIRTFAYPYAFPQAEDSFVLHFLKLLEQTGYNSCVTTIIGRARPGTELLRLPRLPANSADDRALFEAKLAGAYDWMALPQAFSKRLSRWLQPASRPASLQDLTG